MADYQHIVGEAYERLADFIILQATKDYQEALMRLRKHPGNMTAAYCKDRFVSNNDKVGSETPALW